MFKKTFCHKNCPYNSFLNNLSFIIKAVYYKTFGNCRGKKNFILMSSVILIYLQFIILVFLLNMAT